jgi:hypothetical protein
VEASERNFHRGPNLEPSSLNWAEAGLIITRHDERCPKSTAGAIMNNVVEFPFSVSRKAHAHKPPANGTPEERATLQEMVAEEIGARPPAGSLSITGKNERLRKERHEVWRAAEAATHYWRARLDLHGAISWAQRMETPEGRAHPAINDEDRYPLVEKWRAALVRQLLTPAWNGASVKWKQAALARGDHCFTDVKPERIERAIADDLAFLAAHPVRQSNRRRQE